MTDYKQTQSLLDSAATLTKPARLLSLDGGGVKGISSLLILDAIMHQIREKENASIKIPDLSERLPVDYFSLAAGTSTGGLIALMLFRLRMSKLRQRCLIRITVSRSRFSVQLCLGFR
jgi:hypothetical protein